MFQLLKDIKEFFVALYQLILAMYKLGKAMDQYFANHNLCHRPMNTAATDAYMDEHERSWKARRALAKHKQAMAQAKYSNN